MPSSPSLRHGFCIRLENQPTLPANGDISVSNVSTGHIYGEMRETCVVTFVSKSQDRRVTALKTARKKQVSQKDVSIPPMWTPGTSPSGRTLTHEERLALIYTPFPTVHVSATRPWYGVSLSAHAVDMHAFLNGIVPARRNAD